MKRKNEVLNLKKTFRKEEQMECAKSLLYSEFSPVLLKIADGSAIME